MVQLLISVDGDEQVNNTLLRFLDRLEDATPAFDAVAEELVVDNRAQFASEGQFASNGWSPLSPKYRDWKMKRYPGKPILELTGALKESLTERPFGVERINKMSMSVGTGVPYSRFHQNGTSSMPQRRPVELTGERRNSMTKTLQRFLATGSL